MIAVRLLLVVAIAAVVAISPYLGVVPGWTPALVTTIALRALALIGLNLIFGLTGMLAFGQAAFMALPGYISGILEHAGAPLVMAMIAGVVGTVLLARLVAELFVRLPGIYLAVGTLGFGFVVEGVARAFTAWTGGASGLVFGSGRQIGAPVWYGIALGALTLGLVTYWWHVRGAVWRRLRVIRHDELAASVLGIDVVREKVRVFTIGSAYAAVGGLLLAYYVGVLIPEDAGVTRSLEEIGTVLLGGAGLLIGPVIGTALVDWLFVVASYGARYESLIYGAAFLGFVIYAPSGIAGWLAEPWRRLVKGSLTQRAIPASLVTLARNPSIPRKGVCLTVNSVSKRFGGVAALDNVNFDVRFGEIFTLVGPNGAGKTTLFNIISGIVAPSIGAIRIGDHDVTKMPIHSRASFIGRSFQVARLVPELTAKANVMARLDQIASHLSEDQREAIAHEQLRTFGLGTLAERPVRQLSLGQHKLIDLARAAVGDPLLVLLDEPAVGLHVEELRQLVVMLDALRARGSAVLIVEHNIEFVADIAERGVVLDSGRQIAIGPVRDILAAPQVREAYFGSLA
jgi:ABC-type branched-subunit amino acid transport system ATPase component/ABC-type branched-subunit amino acid transport system permease subunit